MNYDPDKNALVFSSRQELEDFHRELTSLIRASMVERTRHIEDPKAARSESQELMRESSAVMRALNLIRRELPHKEF